MRNGRGKVTVKLTGDDVEVFSCLVPRALQHRRI